MRVTIQHVTRTMYKPQALEFRTPLFPHLVPPTIMAWILVWKYIFETFIHILQHFVLQLSRSANFCLFLGPVAVLLKNPIGKKQPWKIRRGNPRFDSIFYNNAPVFQKTFARPGLKNDFPSFRSSLYVRTANIYWRNSSLFSTTTSNFPPLVTIQEVNRAYFVSRDFIGRKDFRNFFSLFFATHGQSISYREAY